MAEKAGAIAAPTSCAWRKRSRVCAASSSATPRPKACSTATPSAPARPTPTASSSLCVWVCSAAWIRSWQDMRVDHFSPFTYGRDIKVSPQDPNTLYACLSIAASSKDGALYRGQDVGKTWQRFDKVTPHGTLMSVGLHHGDAKQVYVAARYGEVFGTQDG